jgi:hypothetical protein
VLFGIDFDDVRDAALVRAAAGWQAANGLDVDGVIGPDTWKALQAALAPVDSLTGIRPADAPVVPEGFEQVLVAFGDPRPLLEADGSISKDNDLRWQRQVLAAGELPFAIPLSPSDPSKGVKKKFFAHRRLVSTFTAAFAEIDRLGLRASIHSWGGIYNFRPVRGGRSLSLHAFGAAIDLNAETNGLGEEGDMDPRVVQVFEHFGFFWGGNFRSRPDPMHFQYATGV